MPTYRMHYLVDAGDEEREAELTLADAADPLDLVQAVAMAYRPDEQQEIGAVVDSLGERAEGLTQAQDLMAQLGILDIRYRVDDQGEEHQL